MFFQVVPECITHVVVDITSMPHGACRDDDTVCHAFQKERTNSYLLK